jgi:hypothetical protein
MEVEVMSFSEWLVGEAGAGWIIGVIGVIGALYTWVKRERAPRIVIQEVETIRLLDIHKSLSGRLNVYYGEKQDKQEKINDLVQKKVVIYNYGTRDILEEINISFQIKENFGKNHSGFCRVILEGSNNGQVETIYNNDNEVFEEIKLTLPYLNSYHEHHEYNTVYILTNNPVKMELKRGSGKGWSSYIVTLSKIRQTKRVFFVISGGIVFIPMTIFMVIFGWIGILTGNNPPQSQDLPSWLGGVLIIAIFTTIIGLPLLFLSDFLSNKYLRIQPQKKFQPTENTFSEKMIIEP